MDYSNIVSNTLQGVKPSGIRKFFDILENRKNVISLTVGEPDFATPWHIRQAGIESLERGRTHYTSNSGTLELRHAISSYLSRRFSLTYDPLHEIIVTVGGSEAIDLTMRSLISPGDEVIIPQPAFVCYAPLCELCGGIPVYINTKEENSFRLTAEELRRAITPKTKLLVLPYPNNPTGAIMRREDLEAISEVLRGTDVMILSDEIYGELTYGRDHVSIASLNGMRERCIIASGFSKAYAMTGWRLGYLCAPEELTRQFLKLHQYAIMCAPTMSQLAAVEAMNNGDDDVRMMRDEYNRRRRFLISGLREIGLGCFEPEGAFYVYPNISSFGMNSEEFCERLLDEYGVAIVPGVAFGNCGEGFARISYAYSVDHISKALERLGAFKQNYDKNNR